jgi:hypothetical protein
MTASVAVKHFLFDFCSPGFDANDSGCFKDSLQAAKKMDTGFDLAEAKRRPPEVILGAQRPRRKQTTYVTAARGT